MLTLEVYKYIKTILRDRPLAAFEGSFGRGLGAKTFSDETRSIHVVTGEAECRAALTQPHFRQHDFAGFVRTALPNDGTESCIASEFFESNPINLNGEKHKSSKHDFLLTFNALRKDLQPEVRSLAQRSLQELTDTAGGASIVDAVSAYVDGVVGYLLGRLGADNLDPALWSGGASCIFEFFPSSARLRKKEAQVRNLLAAISSSSLSDDPKTAIMLSFALQGRDPIAGGLTSFLADLAGSDAAIRDEKLKNADAGSLFRATAPVNYIGRIATRDTQIGELEIATGDEVLVVLTFTGVSSERVGLAFGAGTHVCAGQALALELVNCWLDELRNIYHQINWQGLPPLRSVPAVFQQFEEIDRERAQKST